MLTKEIKDWFGQGEADVDLMLRMGVVTPATILQLWENKMRLDKKPHDNAGESYAPRCSDARRGITAGSDQ